MNLKHILLLYACAMCVGAAAQSRGHSALAHRRDTTSALVSRYVDSLSVVRQRADSLMRQRLETGADTGMESDYFRLFVPLTFYNNIAENNFSIGADAYSSEPDNTLLSMYIRRPDLVAGTQRQLEQAGTAITATPKSVAPDVAIVETVEPNAAETDVPPVDIVVKRPNFWKFSADFGLNVNQNYLSSNWYQSGESSYTVHAAVTLKANYNNKKKFSWENTLELKLGLTNSRGDTLHKVRVNGDNLLRYTGKVGIQASSKWKYTIQLIATTQLFRQFNSNDSYVYSDIFSPLTVNPSVGMDYTVNWFKGKVTGSVYIAPFAYNMTYCHRGNIVTRFGIPSGDHFVDNYGSQFTAKLTWKISNDISWYTRLNAYTSYSYGLIEIENNISFKVNKYLSSTLFFYPRFDDSRTRDPDHGYWQFKEYLAFGFTYSI